MLAMKSSRENLADSLQWLTKSASCKSIANPIDAGMVLISIHSAKKGATPSQIGVVLRDSHGIAQVKVRYASGKLLHIVADGIRLSLETRFCEF
jgi:hypothetical protein